MVALDLAEAMLALFPGIARCSASMTHLPFAVIPSMRSTPPNLWNTRGYRKASEMCRVVKPGGKIVIIDKNAEHWGRLKTPPWEKWFHRKELEKLLEGIARGFQPLHILLGRCGTRRSFPSVDGKKVSGK